MKTTEAIKFFGSKAALAEALGIKQQSINDWSDTVPFIRQQQIEKLTGGKLKAMSLDAALAK